MRELLKSPSVLVPIATEILSIVLGVGLPMILPPSPHLGIVIIGIGSAVSILLFVRAYVIWRRQKGQQLSANKSIDTPLIVPSMNPSVLEITSPKPSRRMPIYDVILSAFQVQRPQ